MGHGQTRISTRALIQDDFILGPNRSVVAMVGFGSISSLLEPTVDLGKATRLKPWGSEAVTVSPPPWPPPRPGHGSHLGPLALPCPLPRPFLCLGSPGRSVPREVYDDERRWIDDCAGRYIYFLS